MEAEDETDQSGQYGPPTPNKHTHTALPPCSCKSVISMETMAGRFNEVLLSAGEAAEVMETHWAEAPAANVQDVTRRQRLLTSRIKVSKAVDS